MNPLSISLRDLYSYADYKEEPAGFLYRLLGEREETTNISHKKMPSFVDHIGFIDSDPYCAWYIILNQNADFIGSIYLSYNDEIGIFISRANQGNGYGRLAVHRLMEIHSRKRYYANINPANVRSIKFFQSLGFGSPIQITLMKENG
jgi:RimJ/RimL family protein N-acetyltransferase